MAKSAEPYTIKAAQGPGAPGLPGGTQVVLLQKGVDAYRQVRHGGTVRVDLGNGQVAECNVVGVHVASLIELVTQAGPSFIQSYGRPYSPLSTIQRLTDESGTDTIDVTELYTSITVTLPNNYPQA